MIEAFLFDLDGTLLDSEILWVEAIKQALSERGYEITDEEALKLVYGRAWTEIREEIRERFPGADTPENPLEPHTERIFRTLREKMDVRIPSSVELLVSLGKRFPVAIVSGSTRSMIAESIRLLGIEPYVRLYVGTEDYGPGKPDPACFLIAAQRLEVPPRKCLVFEDSEAGVKAAKAAGMICVALKRPGRPDQNVSEADEILTDLRQFELEKYSSG